MLFEDIFPENNSPFTLLEQKLGTEGDVLETSDSRGDGRVDEGTLP